MSSEPSLAEQKYRETGDECLVAIIDEGVDIFHKAFLDDKGENTRIIAIWDQTDINAENRGPVINPILGREYTADDINEHIRLGQNLQFNDPKKMSEHGTQVTSISAGTNIGSFSGVACDSKIIVVIPCINGDPGFKAGHIQALDYIKKLAERYEKPVVINISQGHNLGGHDGTAIIEKKCDELSDNGKVPGLVIVTSAGNERNKKRHAELKTPFNSSQYLRWNSAQYTRRCRDSIEIRFSSLNKLRFTLTSPRQEIAPTITSKRPEIKYKFPTIDLETGNSIQDAGNVAEITYEEGEPGQDSILKITITKSSASCIESGTWSLEIKDSLVEEPEDIIYAWIERVPAKSSLSRANAIKFTDEHIKEDRTLTIPATAKSVISVSAIKFGSKSIEIVNSSSYGPTRGNRDPDCYQPFLCALGLDIWVAIPSYKTELHSTIAIDGAGTSFSAAYVTGVIALLLSQREKQCELDSSIRQFNASEIKDLIIKAVQTPESEWCRKMGYGILSNPQHLLNQDSSLQQISHS
jgi:subtilisin family serine protease